MDVFAFGMTMYELLTMKPPYNEFPRKNPAILHKYVRDGRRPSLTDKVISMIIQCNIALTGLLIGYSVIVALTGLPIAHSVIVALTGLPIGYSVIVALTGLPIGYSVIVALTGLPIGYSVIVALTVSL